MLHPYKFYWHDNGIEFFILYINEENPEKIQALLDDYKSENEDTNKTSFIQFLQQHDCFAMESEHMIKESFLF